MQGKMEMTRTLRGLFLLGLVVDLVLIVGVNCLVLGLILSHVISESWFSWQYLLSSTFSFGLAALALPFVNNSVFRFEKKVLEDPRWWLRFRSELVHILVMAICLFPAALLIPPRMPVELYLMLVVFYGVFVTAYMTQKGTKLRMKYFKPIERTEEMVEGERVG